MTIVTIHNTYIYIHIHIQTRPSQSRNPPAPCAHPTTTSSSRRAPIPCDRLLGPHLPPRPRTENNKKKHNVLQGHMKPRSVPGLRPGAPPAPLEGLRTSNVPDVTKRGCKRCLVYVDCEPLAVVQRRVEPMHNRVALVQNNLGRPFLQLASKPHSLSFYYLIFGFPCFSSSVIFLAFFFTLAFQKLNGRKIAAFSSRKVQNCKV